MITVERIDKAIELCNKKLEPLKEEECNPGNPFFMKWHMLCIGLKKFKESFGKIDELLTEVGV